MQTPSDYVGAAQRCLLEMQQYLGSRESMAIEAGALRDHVMHLDALIVQLQTAQDAAIAEYNARKGNGADAQASAPN